MNHFLKILAITVVLTLSEKLYSQSYSTGISAGIEGYSFYQFQVNDTVYVGNDQNKDSGGFMSLNLIYEAKIKNPLYLRVGIEYYSLVHGFWLAADSELVGFVFKGAAVGTSSFYFPAQAGIHFGPFELYGGGGIELSVLSKPIKTNFIDTPELNELHYKVQKLVKPANMYWMGTIAIQFSKRFEFRGQYVESVGSITKNLHHGGEEFIVSTRFARASVALLYQFDPSKIKEHFKKRQ